MTAENTPPRTWTDRQGVTWTCNAYDHGPFCRQCQPVTADGPPSDKPQTAMLLTEDEWQHLAAICDHYRQTFGVAMAAPFPDRLALCGRIIEEAT